MFARPSIVGAALLVATVVAGCATTPGDPDVDAAPSGPQVRVLQMNLCGALGCYGEDVPDRMEVVGFAVDSVTQTRADIVLLNEVCFDQLDAIVRHLEAMSAVSAETLATGNGCDGHGYGNAVLFRGPLVAERVYGSCERTEPPCLENPPSRVSGEQRAMACATGRLPDEASTVTACSVHLVPRGRGLVGERTWDEWNDAQLVSLTRLVDTEFDGDPMIVGGDFNVGPKRVLDSWPGGWTEIDDELRPTRPAPTPRHKLDYIVLSPGLAGSEVELLDVDTCPSSRLDGDWCTDHHPLVGTVTIAIS